MKSDRIVSRVVQVDSWKSGELVSIAHSLFELLYEPITPNDVCHLGPEASFSIFEATELSGHVTFLTIT